jgi:hypothetical protein
MSLPQDKNKYLELVFDKRVDYEYSHSGVCNVFMVNEPLVGKRYIKVTRSRTKKDWALVVRHICDKL